jgi:hypothetical protein
MGHMQETMIGLACDVLAYSCTTINFSTSQCLWHTCSLLYLPYEFLVR